MSDPLGTNFAEPAMSKLWAPNPGIEFAQDIVAVGAVVSAGFAAFIRHAG